MLFRSDGHTIVRAGIIRPNSDRLVKRARRNVPYGFYILFAIRSLGHILLRVVHPNQSSKVSNLGKQLVVGITCTSGCGMTLCILHDRDSGSAMGIDGCMIRVYFPAIRDEPRRKITAFWTDRMTKSITGYLYSL